MTTWRFSNFILSILLFASCASSPLNTYRLESDLLYIDSPDRRLTLDVYRPASKTSTPAVIVIHGGGWTNRSGDMVAVCEDLVRAGFTAINIRYRLAPKSPFPAAVDDVNEAIRWVKENAKKYSIDTSHLYLWGYSAGGHLALQSSLDGRSGIRAVVVGGAPTDLTAYPKSPLIRDFIGFQFSDRPELWRQASPALNLSNANPPPIFMYHGQFDQLVGIDQMRKMEANLKEKNFEVETYQVDWLGHIATYFFAQSAIDKGIAFLKRH